MRPLLLSCLCSVFCLVLPLHADDPTPSFTSKEGETLFKEALDLFEDDRYDEANKKFRSALKHTDAQGQTIVRTWIKACRGAREVEQVEKLLKKKKWRSALKKAEKARKNYTGTPIEPKVRHIHALAHRACFHDLATFDRGRIPMTEDTRFLMDVATFNEDPKYVKQGNRSLRWSARPTAESLPYVPLARGNGLRLEEFRYLTFWVYSPDRVAGQYFILFCAGGNEMGAGGSAPHNSLSTSVKFNRVGWTQVRIDLRKDLREKGSFGLRSTRNIELIMLRGSPPKTIYIDHVRLER